MKKSWIHVGNSRVLMNVHDQDPDVMMVQLKLHVFDQVSFPDMMQNMQSCEMEIQKIQEKTWQMIESFEKKNKILVIFQKIYHTLDMKKLGSKPMQKSIITIQWSENRLQTMETDLPEEFTQMTMPQCKSFLKRAKKLPQF